MIAKGEGFWLAVSLVLTASCLPDELVLDSAGEDEASGGNSGASVGTSGSDGSAGSGKGGNSGEGSPDGTGGVGATSEDAAGSGGGATTVGATATTQSAQATTTSPTTSAGSPTTTSAGSSGGASTTGVIEMGTGGSAMGGTSGSGTGGTGGTLSDPDPALIDDLEDGNSQLKQPTYNGYWFAAADTSEGEGMIDPQGGDETSGVTRLDEQRGDSTRAMHFSGDWDGGWGAAIGFSLDQYDAAIDASPYSGISFWVRTDVPGTEVKLQILLKTVTDGADYEYLLSDLHTLNADWQQISVLFDDLAQPTWAEDLVTFDPRTLYKIQFQFVEGQGQFDLWIDDIWFIEG